MQIKIRLIMLLLLINAGCEHLQKIKVKGETTGTRYSDQSFIKGKHVISARYPISKNMNLKGNVSQQYRTSPLIETELPDYGETSLEILF